MIDHDVLNMRIALQLAQEAGLRGEVPVGAVVFDPVSGQVVAQAANASIELKDPTGHAEIVAMRAAARRLGNYRLTGLTLIVTLEPCAMCAAATSHARIGRLVFGASDPKGGAVVHGPCFFDQPTCHWRPRVTGAVMADEGAKLLEAFFRARR